MASRYAVTAAGPCFYARLYGVRSQRVPLALESLGWQTRISDGDYFNAPAGWRWD
eukprot:IDg18388t1